MQGLYCGEKLDASHFYVTNGLHNFCITQKFSGTLQHASGEL